MSILHPTTTASTSKLTGLRRALLVAATSAVLVTVVGIAPSHAEGVWTSPHLSTTTTKVAEGVWTSPTLKTATTRTTVA